MKERSKEKAEVASYSEKTCPLVHGECLKSKCRFSVSFEDAAGCIFTLLTAYLTHWLKAEKQDAVWETVEGDPDRWLRRLGLRKAESSTRGEATG